MPERAARPYSWRSDPGVPAFDDGKPLFVFDGICVLCSTGAALLMRRDKEGRINMASAQSPLGAALYRHFGLPIDDSYLLLKDGRAFTKSRGYFELLDALGGWWRLLQAARILPERLRDWLYDRVAANRYRWFGTADQCALLSEDQRARLLSKP
jgi:predicted DCC family thiol-disulfide oxidoreductase YuxK